MGVELKKLVMIKNSLPRGAGSLLAIQLYFLIASPLDYY